MDHADLVKGHREGRLRVRMDAFGARQAIECRLLPWTDQVAHYFWVWSRLLWLPLGGGVAVVAGWKWGLLAGGGLAALAFVRSPTRRAADRTLRRALKDPALCGILQERSILIVEPPADQPPAGA